MSAAGFSDLGSVVSWIGHEIDNIVKAGVMSGDNSHFNPDDAMSRVDMAVALVTLVDKASEEVSTDSSGQFVLGKSTPPDNYFDDVRMGYPAHVDNAVSVAYELGITSGVGDGTSFDPSGSVTRGQMAAFITRAMNHTGLRPAGITAQEDGDGILVSVRDANLAPVSNVVVDGFWVQNSNLSRAFDEDGSCDSVERLELESDTECVIDSGDRATGADGDVKLAGPGSENIGDGGATVWVWTGASGAKFNSSDSAAFELELSKVNLSLDGNSLELTTDIAEHAKMACYGSTVNLNIQLVYKEYMQSQPGNATGAGAEDWDLSVALILLAPGDPGKDKPSNTPYTRDTLKVSLDASGAASVPLTANDPDPASMTTSKVRYEISRIEDGIATRMGAGSVRFSDLASEVETVLVDAGTYHTNPGQTARSRAANTACRFGS